MSNSKPSSNSTDNLDNLATTPLGNTSSEETQRQLRLQKMQQLLEMGINPFPASSQRDFPLYFIKFWFNFIFKFELRKNLEKLNSLEQISEEDRQASLMDAESFLYDVFFEEGGEIEQIIKENLSPQVRESLQKQAQEKSEEETEMEFEYEVKKFKYLTEARELLQIEPGQFDREKAILIKNLLLEIVPENGKNEEIPEELDFELAFSPEKPVTLAGRVKSKRVSGKIGFATVEDESCPNGFQFIFKQDLLNGENLHEKTEEKNGEKNLNFEHFKDLIDEGDYIQATGKLDYSQRGEPSLFVEKLQILTKTLRPLPDKFEDKEQRFRQRYVDMRVNTEVREILRMKSKFWDATKEFMDDNGFMQVEAPILQQTTGGAEANPFVTHHNALDEDLYLGISPELHLKRFIVGGFEKVYDLGRNFRNEGIDDEHLQEFSRIEFYWAYANHEQLMDYTEEMIKYVIEKTFGTTTLDYKRKDEKGEFTGEETRVKWAKPWPRMPYYDFIQHFSGIDLRRYKTVEELQNLARSLGIKFEESASFGRLTDLIYKKIARPKCIQPVWMTDVPTRLSPLAKRHPENPEITLRSHLLAYGSELSNGFAELNDPIDQLERFMEQQAARDAGDEEAMMIDLDFVNALEIGLPPTVGFAYSERLFALLANKTMRECAAFPLLRREKNPSAERPESKLEKKD